MRSYTFDDADVDYDDPISVMRHEVKEKVVQALMEKWNSLNRILEMRSWRDRDERMDEDDYIADQLSETYQDSYDAAISNGSSEDEAREIAEKDRQKHEDAIEAEYNRPAIEMELIEEQMAALGARMMRPYEHWNEDERYMEYMENRYDYDHGYGYGDY